MLLLVWLSPGPISYVVATSCGVMELEVVVGVGVGVGVDKIVTVTLGGSLEDSELELGKGIGDMKG